MTLLKDAIYLQVKRADVSVQAITRYAIRIFSAVAITILPKKSVFAQKVTKGLFLQLCCYVDT